MMFKKGYYYITAHTHQLHYVTDEIMKKDPNCLNSLLVERWWYINTEEEYDKMMGDVEYATNRRYFTNQK